MNNRYLILCWNDEITTKLTDAISELLSGFRSGNTSIGIEIILSNATEFVSDYGLDKALIKITWPAEQPHAVDLASAALRPNH